MKRLASLGLFKLTQAESGRQVNIELTDAGKRAYARLERIALERHQALTDCSSEREIHRRWRLLDRFTANAAALLAQEQQRNDKEPSSGRTGTAR